MRRGTARASASSRCAARGSPGAYYHGTDDPATKFDDGWLRTGDVGVLTADGFLTLTDRAKDVIKSGGEWISLGRAGEPPDGATPPSSRPSVVGVPDEKWGERPLATVVVSEGASVDARGAARLPRRRVAHWQLPERWAFIDEVPKTWSASSTRR